MSDREEVVKIANEWLSSGEKVCIATIVRKDGSGPREVGAKMVISAGGRTAGTIGGGVVEAQVTEKAREVIRTGRPVMLDFDLTGESPELDAVCGGNISIFLEPLGGVKSLFIMGAGHVGRALTRLATSVGFSVTLVDNRPEYLSGPDLPPDVQTVAATAEELAVSVNEIGTRVSTASRIVNQVTENARSANLKVEGLATAAQRIGDVVSPRAVT